MQWLADARQSVPCTQIRLKECYVFEPPSAPPHPLRFSTGVYMQITVGQIQFYLIALRHNNEWFSYTLARFGPSKVVPEASASTVPMDTPSMNGIRVVNSDSNDANEGCLLASK